MDLFSLSVFMYIVYKDEWMISMNLGFQIPRKAFASAEFDIIDTIYHSVHNQLIRILFKGQTVDCDKSFLQNGVSTSDEPSRFLGLVCPPGGRKDSHQQQQSMPRRRLQVRSDTNTASTIRPIKTSYSQASVFDLYVYLIKFTFFVWL